MSIRGKEELHVVDSASDWQSLSCDQGWKDCDPVRSEPFDDLGPYMYRDLGINDAASVRRSGENFPHLTDTDFRLRPTDGTLDRFLRDREQTPWESVLFADNSENQSREQDISAICDNFDTVMAKLDEEADQKALPLSAAIPDHGRKLDLLTLNRLIIQRNSFKRLPITRHMRSRFAQLGHCFDSGLLKTRNYHPTLRFLKPWDGASDRERADKAESVTNPGRASPRDDIMFPELYACEERFTDPNLATAEPDPTPEVESNPTTLAEYLLQQENAVVERPPQLAHWLSHQEDAWNTSSDGGKSVEYAIVAELKDSEGEIEFQTWRVLADPEFEAKYAAFVPPVNRYKHFFEPCEPKVRRYCDGFHPFKHETLRTAKMRTSFDRDPVLEEFPEESEAESVAAATSIESGYDGDSRKECSSKDGPRVFPSPVDPEEATDEFVRDTVNLLLAELRWLNLIRVLLAIMGLWMLKGILGFGILPWEIFHEWPDDDQQSFSLYRWPYNVRISVVVIWGMCWKFAIEEQAVAQNFGTGFEFPADILDFFEIPPNSAAIESMWPQMQPLNAFPDGFDTGAAENIFPGTMGFPLAQEFPATNIIEGVALGSAFTYGEPQPQAPGAPNTGATHTGATPRGESGSPVAVRNPASGPSPPPASPPPAETAQSGRQPHNKHDAADLEGSPAIEVIVSTASSTRKPKKRHRCRFKDCKLSFTQQRTLDAHLVQEHDGAKSPYQCELCQKRFTRLDSMKRHLKNMHKEWRSTETGKQTVEKEGRLTAAKADQSPPAQPSDATPSPLSVSTVETNESNTDDRLQTALAEIQQLQNKIAELNQLVVDLVTTQQKCSCRKRQSTSAEDPSNGSLRRRRRVN